MINAVNTHFIADWPKAHNPELRPIWLKIANFAWNIFSLVIFPIMLARLCIKALRNWAFKQLINKTNHHTPDQLHQFAKKLDYQPLTITSPDGTKLNAGYFPPKDHPDKAVIFVPGLGTAWQQIANYGGLHTLGTHVVALSTRGFGLSEEGDRTETNYGLDVWSAYNYLIQEKGLHPDNILLVGHSFGGASGAIGARMVQEEYPDANIRIINWSSYSSFAEATKEMIKRNYPMPGPLSSIFAFFAYHAIESLGGNIDAVSAFAYLKEKVVIWNKEDRIIPMKAQMIDRMRNLPESERGIVHSLELVPDSPDDPIHHSHCRALHSEEERALIHAVDKMLGLKLSDTLTTSNLLLGVI